MAWRRPSSLSGAASPFGIFGLMGQDSHDCAPTSGFVLEDAVLAAERCVETLQAQGRT